MKSAAPAGWPLNFAFMVSAQGAEEVGGGKTQRAEHVEQGPPQKDGQSVSGFARRPHAVGDFDLVGRGGDMLCFERAFIGIRGTICPDPPCQRKSRGQAALNIPVDKAPGKIELTTYLQAGTCQVW